MPLPDEYLQYPHRKRGFDQPFYGWEPVPLRKKAKLKKRLKATATIVVPCEFFPLDPPSEPFRHPAGMKTPYPDLRHYTSRDYGNRVGVFRILRELDHAGCKATFCVDAATAERYPPLLDAIKDGKHEIAAAGVSTAHIHHAGLTENEERQLIERVRSALPQATTWLSPARNESFNTLPLLAEAGFKVCLDWEADMRPLAMKTAHGSITAVPHYNELSDFTLLATRNQSEDEWVTQILSTADDHVGRYEDEGAGAFAFTLTPFIAGQPFRIEALRRILAGLAAMDEIRVCTAAKAVDLFGETP
ncbi:polysaccharide deacetylase family protein [Parvularcula lutaonensis]|uniref:Chitooligosaccharide deacetylase n=1 Tax=Parvularcula lutaonensis TaxID=491923 RepID=A0ABV7MCJ0_9PROT|nr:polysaccharide deacetylase family protein [Parvularcula lutaonensis]GGY38755.1 polysaccharide deacetylase [Parvularcula lutaonensis]